MAESDNTVDTQQPELSELTALQKVLVWACRVLVGGVFILSGWAKSVDPAGFIIKVGEYIAVWHWTVPHEVIVAGCMALSVLEFGSGVMIATGSLRRVSVWFAAGMMAFMLPLTLYIALLDPVADCGCFGDLWIISNWGTFVKNIVISAAVVFLLIFNRRTAGLYPAPIQWLEAVVVTAYPLILCLIGYMVQPVADFRPFPAGATIFHSGDGDEEEPLYIYERGGQRSQFTLDSLPDESWTFVEVREPASTGGADMAVRDEDGEDVSVEIVSDTEPQLWLILPDPGMHYLVSAHYVSDVYEYLRERDIDFAAIVGSRGSGYRYWLDLVRPQFPVYSAEDTALAQLARGNAAFVYTRAGRIVWKRTVASMPDDLLTRTPDADDYPLALTAHAEDDEPNVLDTVWAVDDGRLSWFLAGCVVALLLVLYFLGLSPKLVTLFASKHH